MQFQVLQIIVPDAIHDDVNKFGHDYVAARHPLYAAVMATCFKGSDGYKPEFLQHFTVVATVEADDLEEVFEIGNGYGNQQNITRHHPMHSVSVGDIVSCRDDSGIYFQMVNGMGFRLLHSTQSEEVAA